MSRYRFLAVVIMLLGVLVRFMSWEASRFCDDDSFITFRYAENLANGLGFVYNADERVLGTTTPLFTGLLAIASALGLSLPHVAFGITLLSYAACSLFLYLLLEAIDCPLVGVLASLLYLFPIAGTLMAEIGGMETTFYVALILSTFYCYVKTRVVLAAALAACAFVTRPDGILLAPALGLAYWISHRRLPLRALAAYIAIVLPWIVFAWIYFGSPVPNSVHAKLAFFGTHWTRTPLDIIRTFNSGKTRILLNLLAIIGGVQIAMYHRVLLPVVFFTLSYFVCSVLGSVLIQYWYLPPYFAPLLVLSALGINRIAVQFLSVLARLHPPLARYARPAFCLLLVLALFLRGRSAVLISNGEAIAGQRLLNEAHLRLAHWLAANTGSGARVYCMDIGYVGYFSKRRILDPVGLVSPEAIPWVELGQPVGLIKEQKPAVCVIAMYGIDHPVILADPWFQKSYSFVHRIRADSVPATTLPDQHPDRRTQFVPDYSIYVSNDELHR